MGQARARGTFEERKAQARDRQAVEREASAKAWAEKEAAMTPAQRQQRTKAQMILAAMLGMQAAIGK